MANYYTHVRFMVSLTKEQAYWAERLFDACETLTSKLDRTADLSESERDAIYDNLEFVPADLAEHVKRIDPCREGVPGGIMLSYEEGKGLWVRDDPGTEALAPFIAALLQEVLLHFDIDAAWGFQWSLGTSKPLLDAYGGGACVVTKDAIKWIDPAPWLQRQIKKLQAERRVTKGATLDRFLVYPE